MDMRFQFDSPMRNLGRVLLLLIAAVALAMQLNVKTDAAGEPEAVVPMPPMAPSNLAVILYPPIESAPAKSLVPERAPSIEPPPSKIASPSIEPPVVKPVAPEAAKPKELPLPVAKATPATPPVERERIVRGLFDRVFVADPVGDDGPTQAAGLAKPDITPVMDEQDVAQAIELVQAAVQEPATLPPLNTGSTVTPIPTTVPPTPVLQAGCSTCSNGLGGPAFDLLSGDDGACVPGREGFPNAAAPKTAVGRFLYGVYHCICYPDPCYEPRWTPLADTAFYTPTARPVTQSRFRANLTRGLGTPDRGEYFWPKGIGDTRGPRSADGRRVRRVDDDSFSIYNEAATGMVGVYSVLNYHRVRPDAGPGASGFGDLVIGTKTLLHDCELFQIAFQMETTIPTANSEKGLGTGHLSLEPSVIIGVKLSTQSYFQTQIAEWIPIGGDPEFAGSALRYSFAYNHLLCRPLPDCPIIGTTELIGMTFQDGAFTDPFTGRQVKASSTTYLAVGAGLRAFICDRVDLGAGSAFGVGSAAGPRQEYRIELRVRY